MTDFFTYLHTQRGGILVFLLCLAFLMLLIHWLAWGFSLGRFNNPSLRAILPAFGTCPTIGRVPGDRWRLWSKRYPPGNADELGHGQRRCAPAKVAHGQGGGKHGAERMGEEVARGLEG